MGSSDLDISYRSILPEQFPEELREFQPDLIVSGLFTSNEEAIQALKLLKEEGHDIPFILFKELPPAEEVLEIMKAGALDWITPQESERLSSSFLEALSQKEEREKRREEEARYHALLNASPDLIFLNDKDGVLLDYYTRYPEKLYARPEDFLGKRAQEILPEPVASKLMDACKRAVEENREQIFEYPLPIRGKEMFFEARLVPCYKDTALTFIRDITERKKTEEALRSTSQYLESIIENARVWLDVLDKEGNVLLWNRAAEEISGYTQEEVIGNDYIWEWLYPDREYREEIRGKIPKITWGESAEEGAETIIRTKSGERRVISWNSRNLFDQEDKIIGSIAVGLDITEKKKREEELQRLNHLYAFLSKMNETILRYQEPEKLFSEICQIAHKVGGFRLAWVGLLEEETGLIKPVASAGFDDGYLEKLIITKEKELPTSWGPTGRALNEGTIQISTDLETDPLVEPWRKEVLKRGYRSLAAIPFFFKDKVIGALNIYSSQPNFFTSPEEQNLLEQISNDISFALKTMEIEKERRRAEELRAESERKYRLLFEKAADGILILHKGKIIDFNPKCLEQFGAQEGDILGKYPWEFSPEIQPDGRSSSEKGQEKINLALSNPQIFEWRHKRIDGTIFDCEISLASIEEPGGETLLAIIRDITEKKKMEEELEKARTDFLLSVSHELKTPLFIMSNILELLAGLPPQEGLKKFLEYKEILEKNLQRLRLLVDNIIESQKMQSSKIILHPSLANLQELVEDAIKSMEGALINKSLQVEKETENIPSFFFDYLAMREVVDNILTNAIKFSPQGGKIKITLCRKDGKALLEIKNQSMAIAQDEISSLFQPFHRSSSAIKAGIPGVGLGLYISRQIVEAHGGEISASWQPEQWVTFSVVLPIRENGQEN